jgi:23S rRNA (guanosine2251-2'-O)-methyltransferase
MTTNTKQQASYQQKKRFFDKLLTVYGRKVVLEALQDNSLNLHKLHLADSNQRDGIIRDIETLARKRSVEMQYHDRKALSRISKNGKQDQGVALDIECRQHRWLDDFLGETATRPRYLLALDRVTNPQNLGMIIRSVCASGMAGLILPKSGCAALDALVIKASAGTLFRTPILYCEDLAAGLLQCQQQGYQVVGLSLDSNTELFKMPLDKPTVFVLGNETDGMANNIARRCDVLVKIPMHNAVESLNVAVAAGIVCYLPQLLH